MWKKNDLGLYSLSSNCFVIWNILNQSKVFEYKPTFRLDGGFAVDRDERFIYFASDDGHIRALHNGQVIDRSILFDLSRFNNVFLFRSFMN